MTKRHFIVATAGHVDHGKSALVKALSGIDPDRLPEEKARGITIDLGFAHLELPCDPPEQGTLRLGIVDVPGHEDFVKNMVAGVGSIDLAMLIVAADDGWMPQTEEHLHILTYLDVRHGVVALTKIDLTSDQGRAAATQIRGQLKGTAFENAPIVPTSTVTGAGLNDLKGALSRLLTAMAPPRDLGKPRLPVDRVFSLHGVGTVVTGTLTGGSLRRGQQVVVQPSGATTRIRSIQSHNREQDGSVPGTRTALNLPDVNVGDRGIARGEVVTIDGLGAPSSIADVLIHKVARVVRNPNTARPVKDNLVIRVHHGTGNVAARLSLLGDTPQSGSAIEPGGASLARLWFDEPVFVFAGDRFIIRDWSEQATLAGGIVLDPDPGRARLRSEAQRTLLEARAQKLEDPYVFALSQLLRDHAVQSSQLLVKSRFTASEIQQAVARLATEEVILHTGEWLVERLWWDQLRKKAAGLVQAEHCAHPERLGLPLNQLRTAVATELPATALFDVLLRAVCRDGYVQEGTILRFGQHRPALPSHLLAAGNRLRELLSAKAMEPPSRNELAPNPAAQQALKFLLDTREIVELSDDVVLLASSFTKAVELVRRHLREKGPATVSELRQALGTSRRIMVPVLERMDRDGLTLRQGDRRILKS